MDYASKDELLSGCVMELPERDCQLKNGNVVRIRALKGGTRARVVDSPLEKQMFIALQEGLVNPSLSPKGIQKLIDFSSDSSLEIFRAVMDLSGDLANAEQAETESAEKN